MCPSQPAYASRRRRRQPSLVLLVTWCASLLLLLVCLSSSSLLTATSGASSLKYPCLVCQSFVSTYLQNSLVDRALNRDARRSPDGSQWMTSVAVTALPTPEQFCTSKAFHRFTQMHIYMDNQDGSEVDRLEQQRGGAAPPRFAEANLDHSPVDPVDEADFGLLEWESDVFLSMDVDVSMSEKLALHAQVSTRAELEAEARLDHEMAHGIGAELTAEALAAAVAEKQRFQRVDDRRPYPDPLPPSSVEYYQGKPRRVCLVYEEGYCKYYDSLAPEPHELHTLPNPFTKAYIQRTPDLLKKVNAETRAKKRRQAMHLQTQAEKARIERTQQELLRKAKLDATVQPMGVKADPSLVKPQLPLKYRTYEWCLQLVGELNALPEIATIASDGCTYRNMTEWRALERQKQAKDDRLAAQAAGDPTKMPATLTVDPLDLAMAANVAGTYAWPCPLTATCHGLYQVDNSQPFCGPQGMDTRLIPDETHFMTIGVPDGGAIPPEVKKHDRFTPEEKAAIEAVRRGGPPIDGIKVVPGGVNNAPAQSTPPPGAVVLPTLVGPEGVIASAGTPAPKGGAPAAPLPSEAAAAVAAAIAAALAAPELALPPSNTTGIVNATDTSEGGGGGGGAPFKKSWKRPKSKAGPKPPHAAAEAKMAGMFNPMMTKGISEKEPKLKQKTEGTPFFTLGDGPM